MKGYFRKRGDKWSFSVDIGKDPATGKRKQKTMSGFKTKKEAQAACAELINQIEKGGYQKPSKLILSDFMEQVIESEIKPNFRPSTIEGYETARKIVNRTIGHKEMSKLTTMDINEFIKHLRDIGCKNGTIKTHLMRVKKVLRVAFKWNVINVDIASTLDSPKQDKSKKYWSYEECMEFISKSKDDQYHMVYLLTIFTGLRRGEILGLPLKNIDFENNLITVSQQIIVVGGKALLEEDNLKTSSSFRVIDVPPSIMEKLRKYSIDNRKKYMQLGISNQHNLLFTTSRGTMIHPNNLSNRFRKLCTDLKMSMIPFHGLRHSHATILAESKESIHAISDRLGHSSTTVTNEMYIHLTKKMKTSLSEKLNSLYNEGVK
ncbi:hypothetical protein HMPREF3291_05075 [Bacillus sp. HMSC76G11]|nr:hypothetical protein HMPREF3291_05075 [Bacillus sp. HMSC76G11]